MQILLILLYYNYYPVIPEETCEMDSVISIDTHGPDIPFECFRPGTKKMFAHNSSMLCLYK